METIKINISETIGGRLDPQFYNYRFNSLIDRIKTGDNAKLSKIAKFSSETWNQKDFWNEIFPYIEISAIDTISGDLVEISQVEKVNAPSRAKKIVRNNDILVSTTRPNRGAITLLRMDHNDTMVASTGFAVIRDVSSSVLREYLFIILRQNCCLDQMLQRSSGGNYPAITEEELKKIQIPLPSVKVQNEIVDLYIKVQQKKQDKDQEAKALIKSIDCYLLEQIGVSIPETPERQTIFKVNISQILGQRFDTSFYKYRFELSSSIYPHKKLADVVQINPSVDFKSFSKDDEISFIPMDVIDEKLGIISQSEITTVSKIQGFTKFSEGDLLWAKITPCMQNGKSAIARNLKNGVGCGSTEFFVMRPKNDKISIEYVYCLLRHHKVLEAAKNSFGGSAGQQRVSSGYLKSIIIPLPPIEKQIEIAESIMMRKIAIIRLQQEISDILCSAKLEIEKILFG